MTFCSPQPATICAARLGPDAGHLTQSVRLSLDQVEYSLAEGDNQFFGVHGSDPANHPRPKVAFDTVESCRRARLQERRLELDPVFAVIGPGPAGLDELAGGDARGVAHYGDKLTLSSRLDPQNAEAVIRIVEADALDHSSNEFLSGQLPDCSHESDSGADSSRPGCRPLPPEGPRIVRGGDHRSAARVRRNRVGLRRTGGMVRTPRVSPSMRSVCVRPIRRRWRLSAGRSRLPPGCGRTFRDRRAGGRASSPAARPSPSR
jgi:hypothetical protein